MNGRTVTIRALLVLLCLTTLHWSAVAGQWTDDMGRSVRLDSPPQRIVSLVPSVTEILFAIGADGQLVGVTDFCDYPAEARRKPQMGAYSDPSLEAIVAARPNLVFASAEMHRPGFVERLQRMGIAVYVVNPGTMAEVVASLRGVGRVAGRAAQAEVLATSMEQRIRAVEERAAGKVPPRVLFSVMVNPLVVAGPGTMTDDLLRVAGGINVVPDGPSRYPTWGIEGLLAIDPEVIVATPHTAYSTSHEYFLAWPQLQAVQQNRIVSIHSDWVHRPGPRLVQGLEALHQALHGKE
ncbi:cobalamin-binding protein [Desulfurispirillum indicum]|uniref:cobalamin-binding protein n=1 Tax=Desulfurispirillum indicum TaxID=936456 RepID=UPI001CF9F428|nr:cobalamin-binding protein [Desulfurispirillum indicum]UCZ55671.1 cobalamin-binding protein [Desulfurispirillum indicum]